MGDEFFNDNEAFMLTTLILNLPAQSLKDAYGSSVYVRAWCFHGSVNMSVPLYRISKTKTTIH